MFKYIKIKKGTGDFVRNGPNPCSSEVGGGNLIGFVHWSSQHRDKHTARKTGTLFRIGLATSSLL